MIRVVIADDHVFMREGVRLMLEANEEIEVIGTAGNGKEAFELCESLKPDIVLMDLVMPEYGGIDGLKRIKSGCGDVKVLILTTFGDEENLSRALKYDADGYLLKDVAPDVLEKAVKAICSGLKVIHPEVYPMILKSYKYAGEAVKKMEERTEEEEAVSAGVAGLSEREKQILQLIVYGKSNKEIGAEINLSDGRVKNIVTDLLERFGLKARTQLAVFAVKNKLLG